MSLLEKTSFDHTFKKTLFYKNYEEEMQQLDNRQNTMVAEIGKLRQENTDLQKEGGALHNRYVLLETQKQEMMDGKKYLSQEVPKYCVFQSKIVDIFVLRNREILIFLCCEIAKWRNHQTNTTKG